MEPKLVSIVIVNYNAGSLLRHCLESIAQQTYTNWEVIVVDNASHDDSLTSIEGFERVTIIRNGENRGFAAAQNQGLRLARGAYLMPLNFDIEMTESFLEEMVKGMALSESIGSATGKLLQMLPGFERTERIYSTGHVLPDNRFPVHRGSGEIDSGQYQRIELVFGAPGAAPLYRREMLEDVAFRGQYFDEFLFTWYEDIDLDWRAYHLGWGCVYLPKAVAYHIGHPEGHAGNSFQIATTIRNRWLVILANERFERLGRRIWAMLGYELSLIRYVVLRGYGRAYVSALCQSLRLASRALEKRRWTLGRAQANRACAESLRTQQSDSQVGEA